MKRYIPILLILSLFASALDPKPLTDEIYALLADSGMCEIQPDKSEAFQRALLKAIQQGSGQIVGLEITSAKPKDGDEEAAFRVGLSFQEDNATVLFSLDCFNGNLKRAMEDMDKFATERKGKALLIDLRKSGGDDENAAKQLIDFCKGCKMPLGVLADGGTHAVAESVLSELKACGATFFGAPTAGYPGPRKSVTLSNGSILHIPPKKSAPLAPDFAIPENEAWIQVASDLLIARGVIMTQKDNTP